MGHCVETHFLKVDTMRLFFRYAVLAFSIFVNPCFSQEAAAGGGSQGEGAVAGGAGGDFWTKISLENHFKENEEYGFLTASQTILGQKEKFSYVCIVKHQYTDDENAEIRYKVKLNNGRADARHCMFVNGYGFLVQYSSELSENHTRITNEDITINGKKIGIEKGRVFVIGMKARAIEVKQIKLEMPIELRSWEPRASVPEKIWAEKLKQAVEKNEIATVSFDVIPQKNCGIRQLAPDFENEPLFKENRNKNGSPRESSQGDSTTTR